MRIRDGIPGSVAAEHGVVLDRDGVALEAVAPDAVLVQVVVLQLEHCPPSAPAARALERLADEPRPLGGWLPQLGGHRHSSTPDERSEAAPDALELGPRERPDALTGP